MIKRNKIAIIGLGASVFLLLIQLVMDTKGVYFQLGPPSKGIGHHTISALLIIAAVISAVYMLTNKGMKWMAIGIGIFFILVISAPNLLMETKYTTFSSPDQSEKFVAIEKGYVKLYQVSNSGLFMTALTKTRLDVDREYKPFSEGAYELEWESPNTLIVHYAFNYKHQFKTIELQYQND
jgi:hypothetical protein